VKVYDGKEARQFEKRLAKRHKNTIAARENEIQDINKLYDKKVKLSKVENEKQLLDIRDRNADRLNVDFTAQQKKLDDYQKSLTKTQGVLENQKGEYIKGHRDNLAELGKYYDSKFKAKNFEGQVQTKEIQEKVRDAISKSQIESDSHVQELDRTAKTKSAENTALNESRLVVQNREHTIKETQKDFEHAETVANKMNDHQRQIFLLERQQKTQKREALAGAEQLVKTQNEQHKQILKQEKVAFQQKYDTLLHNHQLVYDNLKQRFAAELESLTNSQTENKAFLADRQTDKFYNIDRMNPEIKEFQDEKGGGGYVFAIKVPSHEMESLNLSAHERKIKINYSRRHSGRSEDVGGAVNLAKRSESVTREFQVADIVDPATITQQYKDGKLFFKIAKR
jgi:HSP20 family molecular chaperone IbpA